MSDIKIFVTHIPNRDDQLIENSLMVDVIAGGEFQTKEVPTNCVLDNSGDNISLKNKSFCELTTQYWAWKNVDADYYGFCHYRRFLSLTDEKFSEKNDPTNRGQIYSKILNEITIKKYGLDNAIDNQAFIEKYDCILPAKQDLRKLPTPNGKKKTVYDHFAAHDRYFMHASDLELLIEIIEELFPEYKSDAIEYLNNSYFWGYNCFIIKKEYFQQLCNFEFSILFELENRVDVSMYNRQISRVPGFMGEILSCIYFYHLQKINKSLKIKETQIIYFEHTDKMCDICPIEKNIIPVVFNIDPIPPFMFTVTLESFVSQCLPNRKYDVYILHHNISKNFLDNFNIILKKNGNIKVRYIDYNIINRTIIELDKKTVDIRLLLPWLFIKYNKILYCNWNTMFTKSLDDLFMMDIENYYIAGAQDIIMTGKVFDVSPTYEKYLKKEFGLNLLNKFINTDVCLINTYLIRNEFLPNDFLMKDLPEKVPTFKEKCNSVFKNKILILPQAWNYYYTEDIEEKRLINQAPLKFVNEYNNARDFYIATYNANIMWDVSGSKFCTNYWKVARTTDFYPLFLGHFSVVLNSTNSSNKSWFFTKLDGLFKCIQDHGFAYTFVYFFKKLFLTLQYTLNKRREK